MNTITTGPVIHCATRIAGVDVDQLLRDIGEASACTSPIELFRLCLSAQNVLVQAGAGTLLKATEARMDAVSHVGAGQVHAQRGARLTDADCAAIVKRYEDAGDVQNADIIRPQWETTPTSDDSKGGAKHGC